MGGTQCWTQPHSHCPPPPDGHPGWTPGLWPEQAEVNRSCSGSLLLRLESGEESVQCHQGLWGGAVGKPGQVGRSLRHTAGRPVSAPPHTLRLLQPALNAWCEPGWEPGMQAALLSPPHGAWDLQVQLLVSCSFSLFSASLPSTKAGQLGLTSAPGAPGAPSGRKKSRPCVLSADKRPSGPRHLCSFT